MPKMVNGGAVLPKTALFSSQEAVSFKFSHQSGIDHFLHNFAEATSQCYWAVIRTKKDSSSLCQLLEWVQLELFSRKEERTRKSRFDYKL